MLIADGFDTALIGVGERCGSPDLVVYDAEKCVSILMQDGMDRSEAHEYFTFNTLGSYVGGETPIYVWRMTKKEINER